jgi:CubicO group peptidase (beta-lactamase class C family)
VPEERRPLAYCSRVPFFFASTPVPFILPGELLMKMRPILFACWITLLLLAAPAQGQFASVAPEAAGFAPARLARLDAVVQDYVDRGQLAGAVALIARDGKAVHLESYGLRDVEAGLPMTPDAIFRIASMTKAVTTVAVMMLYEEGHFLLSDPVAKYIPAFADAVVAVPPPAGAPDSAGFVTVPAERPITIRHLLTHTAGLTYGSGPAEALYEAAGLTGWYFADREEPIGAAIERLAGLPLAGQPGEAWQYGFATDVLGYLVEVVSGMPLDAFFETRIFAPLQMHDTFFFIPPDKVDRLAPVYGLDEGGHLTLREPAAESDYVEGPRTCFSGGAGLLSTITDYARFLQMLLGGGALDGVRLLAPKTVALMTANHVGDRFEEGRRGFGLGFWVMEDVGKAGDVGTEGAYGWGSAYYPIYWVDPAERLIGIIMTQLRPAGGLDLNRKFYTLTYQALID